MENFFEEELEYTTIEIGGGLFFKTDENTHLAHLLLNLINHYFAKAL